jgi:hypothetical protein
MAVTAKINIGIDKLLPVKNTIQVPIFMLLNMNEYVAKYSIFVESYTEFIYRAQGVEDMRLLILLGIFGISFALMIIIPTYVNAQQTDNKAYFQGNYTVVIRINNPYNASQWQDVDSYTTNGYRIMSIIPSSALYPDPKNPSLILVVLQKFN